MDKCQYSPPVSTLLTYGSTQELHDWPDYLQLGFTREHIPALITLLTDDDLNNADPTSDEVWAPIHAWRTLGQLRAAEAIPALLDQLWRIDEESDEWVETEFPDVFALIGSPAISGLNDYLANYRHSLFARVSAAQSLRNIEQRQPDTRQACVEALECQLKRYLYDDSTLNGFLIGFLVELKAVEVLPTIQAAYRNACVDLSVTGDCEDVEIALGVRKKRTTSRPRFGLIGGVETSPHSVPARNNQKKIGRNDLCPCGSGKKYKKCCLNR